MNMLLFVVWLVGLAFLIVSGVINLIKKIIRKPSKSKKKLYLGVSLVTVLSFFLWVGGNDKGIAFLVLGFFCLIATGVMLINLIVRKAKGKPFEKWRLVAAAVLLVLGLFFPVVSFGKLTLYKILVFGFFISSIAFVLMTVISLVLTVMKKARRRIWLSLPICIALMMGFWFGSDAAFVAQTQSMVYDREAYENNSLENNYDTAADSADSPSKTVEIRTEVGFEMVDGDTPIEIFKGNGLDGGHSFSKTALTKDYVEKLDITHNVTPDMCIQAIKDSKTIDELYKPYFVDFVERMAKKFPDTCFDMLYNNLKTLQVVVLGRMQYFMKSMSLDSSGCYRRDDNAIYIPEGTEFVEGEWGFQVLIHEFCHASRSSWYEDENGNPVHIQYSYLGSEESLLEECMNSVYSCELLNYEEKDIAYQLPSNYLRIILECMDNFELTDYMNNCPTYFFSKLDEATGYTNYAQKVWALISLQRQDGGSEEIDIPAEEYYPIYDFLCDMYYGKYITNDMTDVQKKAVADELVEKAFFDVNEEFKPNPQYFYDYLAKYAA